jgi:pimeloyl-ACP methyl ester carboxylesterase
MLNAASAARPRRPGSRNVGAGGWGRARRPGATRRPDVSYGRPWAAGLPFLTRVKTRLRAELAGDRLVVFDQRRTGAGALACPELQRAAGASDLTIVPAATVAACARSIGENRRYYSTSVTVADIDQLRAALGVPRLTLDGVSYGTYVAERYALAHPSHVARMVLDSVVPQTRGRPALFVRRSPPAGACCARYARSRCSGIRQPTSPRLSTSCTMAPRCWMPWSPTALGTPTTRGCLTICMPPAPVGPAHSKPS